MKIILYIDMYILTSKNKLNQTLYNCKNYISSIFVIFLL